jgi:hypothetical protein
MTFIDSSSSSNDPNKYNERREQDTTTNNDDSTNDNNNLYDYVHGISGIDGSEDCNPPCNDGDDNNFNDFCGKDGVCYPRTCQNLYLHGNSSFYWCFE